MRRAGARSSRRVSPHSAVDYFLHGNIHYKKEKNLEEIRLRREEARRAARGGREEEDEGEARA